METRDREEREEYLVQRVRRDRWEREELWVRRGGMVVRDLREHREKPELSERV